MIEITTEQKDNILWIKISGRMVLDASLFRLHEQVLLALEAGSRKFIVDLSGVSYLDSSGCGQVISAHTSVQRAKGSLVFLNPSERIRVLWAHTKLAEVLSICETADQARGLVLS